MKKTIWIIECLINLLTVAAYSQWIQTNIPPSVDAFSLAVSDSVIFVGTDSAVYLSTDGGLKWVHPMNSGMQSNEVIYALAIKDTFVFAGNDRSGVFRSSNLGLSWQSVNNGLPISQVYSLLVVDSFIFAGTYRGIFRSSNNGMNWQAANSGMPNSYFNTLVSMPDSLGVAVIFTGATSPGSVFRSSNFGINWQRVNNGLVDSAIYVLAVGTGSYMYAATFGKGVFRTSNYGDDWTAVNNGLGNLNIVSLAAASDKPGDSSVVAGTFYGGGVYGSSNSGASWSSLGLTGRTINVLAITPQYIIAGIISSGSNAGVWLRSRGTSPVQDEGGELPQEYLLEQNYPNPFNPTTNIRYALAHESRVSLKLYNIFGQLVQNLIDEVQSAGYKSLSFDANNLSSGIYFYRLQAGKFTDTKKFLLIK